MNRSLLWRGVLILAVVVAVVVAAWPLDEKLKLGLDLRGGMYLVLGVQTQDAVRAESEADRERLDRYMAEEGFEAVTTRRVESAEGEPAAFEVSGLDPEALDHLRDNDDLFGLWRWNRTGDTTARFEMRSEAETEVRVMAVRQAIQTIRNRIDAFGVTEPVITEQLEEERIVVQLPGVDDPERVKDLIKDTAFLEFRIVDFPSGGMGAASRQEILAHYGGRLPGDIEILPGDIRDEVTDEVIGEQYYAVEASAEVTGRDLRNARRQQGQFGEPVVGFSLNADGAQKFGRLTGENVGRQLAIVLDGRIVSAPRINSQITDSGIIEGGFTLQEVQDLVTTLRSGALPAGLEYLEERTVGPSLGQDSIDQGLEAGMIGGALIVLIMLLFYRLAGVNAVIVLTVNVVLVFGALAYFGATLTLPGIAGIILVVGMAVDGNVLVFERIKEELRKGRTVRAAIDSGFANATSSIVDANVTTLIAALFLFQFGTGPIRGFAVTLSVGVLSSLFTVLFVSRWLFDLRFSRRRRVERMSI